MTTLRWTGRVLRYDQRVFWRTPPAAFFTIVLPVLMLVIFGSLNRGGTVDALGDMSFVRYLLVGQVAFVLAGTAYGNLAARLTYRRESGIFQRLRTTPVPAGALVAGQIASTVAVVVVTLAVLLGVAAAFYDVAMPTRWSTFALVVVLGSACCCALGTAVSTFVPNVEAIDPIVFATMLPITFISGAFQYVPAGSSLGRVAGLFPVRHLVVATLESFGVASEGPLWHHLAVVAAWGVGATVVAVRRFRWAPSRS